MLAEIGKLDYFLSSDFICSRNVFAERTEKAATWRWRWLCDHVVTLLGIQSPIRFDEILLLNIRTVDALLCELRPIIIEFQFSFVDRR